MHSRLFHSRVEHERFFPSRHSLGYDIDCYAIDLDELPDMDRTLPLFGYNRRRPVAIHDEDYLDRTSDSIRRKLLARLGDQIDTARISRTILVTVPRWLGYIFNPVSFYFCFADNDRLAAAVAEVNNTFGEKHLYRLPAPPGGTGFPARFTAPKVFHVSPFNDMEGIYHFQFGDIRRELDIRIALHRGERLILEARLRGTPRPLTVRTQFGAALHHPLRPHLTMPRIYREAAILSFRRGLPFFTKPVPRSPLTIGRRPATPLQHHCMKRVLAALEKTDQGRLQLTLPDGSRREFGRHGTVPAGRVRIQDYRFFSRVALGSDIGLGEAFMLEEWDTDDIAAVLAFFIRNRQTLQDGDLAESLFSRLVEKVRYLTRRNTLPGSRRNIGRHYDLSNAFFQTFLDRSMAYSCALFAHPGESLEAAQQRKYRRIIAKARLTADDHLLEIGCGWGGFALEAVRRSGCRVTGITISRDQYQLARERVRAAGLADRIRILFCDYRKMRGRFDKIVSIEMLEAVGHAYFGLFFRRLDQLLAADGIAVLQTITIADPRYARYRRSHDWIRKHIFPGGLLPSLSVLSRTLTRHSSLMIDHVENIGNHYALTLAEWQRRFTARSDEIDRLGFDRSFQRKWRYYLGSCEAGFRERALGDLQLVLTREGNRRLMDLSETPPG